MHIFVTMSKEDSAETAGNKRSKSEALIARYERWRQWAVDLWNYCMTGVWRDPRSSLKVSVFKTINLGIRSFLDSDLQLRSAALTYNTVLAIVPVLALIFAIGRGFGFQNLLQGQMYEWFPTQQAAVETGLKFVDSYLNQASEGLFVGVGLVFLLWTMISLLGNVEDAFNKIWDVKRGRSIWRKITDYLAIFLVLPILMICASGLTLVMSKTINSLLPFAFLTPAISLVLDIASFVFTWLFFAVAYMLIPNTKVKFVNAIIAGVFAGTAFRIVQWLFVSGQLYVAKYNAIYGSFSFLPLLMVWLYFTWLITLIGAVICYASQNIVAMSFIGQISKISANYRRKVCVVIMTLICQRFYQKFEPLTVSQLAATYHLPERLVKDEVERLVKVRLLNYIDKPGEELDPAVQPAVPVESLAVGTMIELLDDCGDTDFIPLFTERFNDINVFIDKIDDDTVASANKMLFIDLSVKL